ncbi:MAG: OmpA family protein [Gemmatimonadaceae bacterium]|nr:OmpA family protein [Gemmatimonadaceae bacterium]
MLTLAARGFMAMVVSSTIAFAQEVKQIPLVRGLTLVSATQLPSGDQENVVTVGDVSPQGVSYGWTFRQQKGNAVETGTFQRFVRIEDLTAAPRLNSVFFSSDVDRFPGSTAFSISRAVLQKLKAGAPVSYSLAKVDGVDFGTGWAGAIGGGLLSTRVYMRGTLTPAPKGAARMSLLVNGRRVAVPVAQARGSFALRDQKLEGDFFVLDDPEHPLLLRAVVGGFAFQMIRADFPGGGSAARMVESELESKCRAEVPGVYFEFGSAQLRTESDAALSDIARALAAHPAWKLSIEGHTDAVGTAASNLSLSQRRAEAVKAALSMRYRVPAARLTATGFGRTKPKEPNATLEGRARNRRVEIVRSCAGRQ